MARIDQNCDRIAVVRLTREEYRLLADGAADSIILDQPGRGTVMLRIEEPHVDD